MAKLLLEVKQNGVFYRIIWGNDRHLLIQEVMGNHRRSYRISQREFDQLLKAHEAERLKVARDIYHQARLKRARKRANGGDRCDQLVPTM